MMSKRPRTEPPTCQDDIWGDDFTFDEVNSIDNIETLASQSQCAGKFPNAVATKYQKS